MPAILETEIKLPVRDLRELLARLRRLGARSHGRVFEQNVIYDTPDADFRRQGRLVRLRLEKSSARRRAAKLTSKAPPNQPVSARLKSRPRHKQRLECEVAMRDPGRAAALLESIGFRPSFRYDKYRTSFRLGALHLDLDETPVGSFLELEGRPAAIDRVARELGYKPADYIRGTYWDLYAADCRRRGRKPKNMLFTRKNPRNPALFA
jgi:adenylate cyclase class 2